MTVVHGERELREVGLSADRRDQRSDQVSDERSHNGGEGQADHHRDCEIDQVAAQQELPETAHVTLRVASDPDIAR
jgi:hypothetical protein